MTLRPRLQQCVPSGKRRSFKDESRGWSIARRRAVGVHGRFVGEEGRERGGEEEGLFRGKGKKEKLDGEPSVCLRLALSEMA